MEPHKRTHPGIFFKKVYLDELGISINKAAKELQVSPSTVSRLVNGDISMTADMALRISTVYGTRPEIWLSMQQKYNLWKAKKTFKAASFKKSKTLATA